MDNFQENSLNKDKTYDITPGVPGVPGVPAVPSTPSVTVANEVTTTTYVKVKTITPSEATSYLLGSNYNSIAVSDDGYISVGTSTKSTVYTTIPGDPGAPAIPAIPAIPPVVTQRFDLAWNGSANSINSIASGDYGSFAFNVSTPFIGIAAGLSVVDNSSSYSDIKYGFVLKGVFGLIIIDGINSAIQFTFNSVNDRLTVQRTPSGIEWFVNANLIHQIECSEYNEVLFGSCSLYSSMDSILNANISTFYYGRYLDLDTGLISFGSNNKTTPANPSITNFSYIEENSFNGILAPLIGMILDGSSGIGYFDGSLQEVRSTITDDTYTIDPGDPIDPPDLGDLTILQGMFAINGAFTSYDLQLETLNQSIGALDGKIYEEDKAYFVGYIPGINGGILDLIIVGNDTVCDGILPNAYSVTASMIRTPVIDANINLPSLTGKASFGASVGKTLPKMTGSAHMTVARMFSCSKTLKPLTGEASVTVGIVMSVEKTLPRLTGYAKVAKNINTSGTLPRLTGKSSIVSTAKNNIAGSGTLPRLTGKACFGGSVSGVFKRLVLNAASIETGTLITAKHTLKPLVGGGSIKKYGTAEASGTLPMLVATRYATASGRLPRLSGFAESKKAIAFNTSNYTGYCINLKNVVKYKEQQAFQLTQFDNFVFNSIQRVGNKYYGVNSTGLYEITGNTDNGSTINWQIVTHLSDFKIRNLKTIRYAYVRGRMTNDYEFNVYSEEEMSNEHSKIFSSSYKATNSRVVLGKGLTGSYYGFEMIGSGPVELDQIDIDYDILSRGLK